MPILEPPPNPSRATDPANQTTGEPAPTDPPGRQFQPIKVRTGRFGELEEHELIHLLDSLDDERSRARFRESIYISVIIYAAIAWFLFYGPRVLFHQPEFRDPIALMKQHDKELTYITPSLPAKPGQRRSLRPNSRPRRKRRSRPTPPRRQFRCPRCRCPPRPNPRSSR